MKKSIGFYLGLVIVFFSLAQVHAQTGNAILRLLDRKGNETVDIVDGNSVRLSIQLPAPVSAAADVRFVLEGTRIAEANCSISAGGDTCASELFPTLGWYWGEDGRAYSDRRVHATVNGLEVPGELLIHIRPRPVVMVHGFISSWETWQAYLGLNGYLASMGVQGFAVGDGQAQGVLNTGSASAPAGRTNSIQQNAEIVGEYIAGVQKLTGAEKVDLLVHSMGGMITRYYLDRVMTTENVAQVIFLGSPMAGSACTYPLAAMGYLMPASQEILPYYMVNVFNQQILHRHGIPFHMVAGTLLIDPLTSPCAEAPSDTVVALGSATSILMEDVQKLPMFHGNFTSDRQVFEENVKHLLQAPPGSFAPRPDLAAPSVSVEDEQFSRVYGGHLNPGETAQVTIEIDPNVSLANFSLFDSSRTLGVEVRGASGKVIELDTAKNGLMKIEDPSTMLYLGYGFKEPKPGKWVITLKTSPETPATGADYAMTARFTGGVKLTASTSSTILDDRLPVTISADLQTDGAPISVKDVTARIRKPDGAVEEVPLVLQGGSYSAAYQPVQAGLYTVEVALTGTNADGFGIDRAAFLAFEVQPAGLAYQVTRIKVLAGSIAMLLLLTVIVIVWALRLARTRRKKNA